MSKWKDEVNISSFDHNDETAQLDDMINRWGKEMDESHADEAATEAEDELESYVRGPKQTKTKKTKFRDL